MAGESKRDIFDNFLNLLFLFLFSLRFGQTELETDDDTPQLTTIVLLYYKY